MPHDLDSLAILMGGKDKAAQKLHTSFEESSKLGFTIAEAKNPNLSDAPRRAIPINYGNKPSIHTAFIFNHLGKPHLTQFWLHEVINKMYEGLTPDTEYGGDENQGLMGALAVLMKIGLFEMKAGCEQQPMMEICTPSFNKIIIQLDKNFYKGNELTIHVKNNTANNILIKKVTFNVCCRRTPYCLERNGS